jgi:cytochrome c oxidase subunit III
MERMMTADQEFKEQRTKAQRNLLWLSLGSIVMVFAGLTSAYVVRKGAGDWYPIQLPQIFWVSTAVLIFSSVSINLSLQNFKQDKKSLGIVFLTLTIVLGLIFTWTQFSGWNELTENGVFLVHAQNQSSLISGSFIYILSGLHLAHLAGGLIALFTTFILALRGRYGSKNIHGVRLCAVYWHFLDLLWIYLFVFLTIFK